MIQGEELKELLSTSGGRWLIWRLLEQTKLFASITSNDAMYMAAMSGRRDLGLWLVNEIMYHCPEYYSLMQQEAYGRQHTDEYRDTTD